MNPQCNKSFTFHWQHTFPIIIPSIEQAEATAVILLPAEENISLLFFRRLEGASSSRILRPVAEAL